MTRKSAVLLGIVALCWMRVTPAQAAAKAAPTPVPDLTQNGKKDGLQYWNLGPTGVFVFLWRVDEPVPEWEERNK